MPTTLRRRIVQLALSFSVFVVVLVGVEYLFGWRVLLAPWTTLSVTEIGSAVALLIASYLFRAQRIACYFRQTSPATVRFLPTVRLVLLHNCLNNLLPTRTGEISFPVLVRRYFGIDLVTSVPALLWLRFMDMHTLALIGLIGLSGLHHSFLLPGLLLTLLWLPLPAVLLVAQPRVARWAQRHAKARVARLAQRLIEGLPHQYGHFFQLWGYTLINWVAKIIAFAWVLHLFAEIALLPSLLGAITGDVTSVLPFHGFAGAGSYEAGVMAGLALFGIAVETGLPAAVNLHLFVLGGSFLGVIPALMIPVHRRTER